MTKRRLIVLTSALALLSLGALVALFVVSVTHTSYGRAQVRRLILAKLAPAVKGSIYIGQITGGLLTGVTVDSLEIRDDEDSLFVASGPVTVQYDPRDLIDKRVLLKHVTVLRPQVALRQHENGEWNFRRIFGHGGPSGPKGPGRSFGDYIVIDSANVTAATLVLTMPWHPDDSLRAAKRDSAITYNLGRADHEIRATGEGYARTYRWTNVDLALDYARLADPDTVGKLFVVGKGAAHEFDPPFDFRNLRGTVRNLGDSIWLDIPHFDLPASTGSAKGKVVWGSDLPVRYAIDVHGDSVALADVAWVYPTLPATGGGSTDLAIRNETDLHIIDYVLRRMDMRSTNSHLTGTMTFAVGGPVLAVKDVKMQADPLDFRLIKVLNGKPFPYDWAGQLTGTVDAPGGPLTHFQVRDAQVLFRDAHVAGAWTRARAHGELDILYPALTAFHGFSVQTEHLDPRTVEFLNPNFPRLHGLIAGTTVLDSSWLDVRFRDAHVTYSDGALAPTQATGSGRVTYGTLMDYDVDLQFPALSFDVLAPSYPMLPLRGVYTGPMKVKGTLESLELSTALRNVAGDGSMQVSGRFDFNPPGFSAAGTGSFNDLDLAALLGKPHAAQTALTGRATYEVHGDSLANLVGPVELALDRSSFDDVRVYPSFARLHFGNGIVHVDTVALATSAGALSLRGGLGLVRGASDTLHYAVGVDSLGGWRRFLSTATGPMTDSLSGGLLARGWLAGSIDSLDVLRGQGTADAGDLVYGTTSVRAIHAEFGLEDLLRNPTGSAALSMDTMTAGGVLFSRARADVRALGRNHATVEASLLWANGPTATGEARLRFARDTMDIALDSLLIETSRRQFSLAEPGFIHVDSSGTTVQSLVLRGKGPMRFALQGRAPVADSVHLSMRVDSMPLFDLAELAQLPDTAAGRVQFALDINGTRANPVMVMQGSLAQPRYGDFVLEAVTTSGTYAQHRANMQLNVLRGGRTALEASGSLPIDLAMQPRTSRLPDDSLRMHVRTDSVDLGILDAFAGSLLRPIGDLAVSLDVTGTWKDPLFAGSLAIRNGSVGITPLGVRVSHLNTDVRFDEDSVIIRQLSAQSGPSAGDTLSLSGFISDPFADDPHFRLSLFANDFHIINKARVADLWLNGRLALKGKLTEDSLTGALQIPRGNIYIPEIVKKDVVSLEDADLQGIVDTSITGPTIVPTKLPEKLQILVANQRPNVSVSLGEDVWLRSQEANIQLNGGIGITRSPQPVRNGFLYQPVLTGTLGTVRGIYRLNLGLVQRDFAVSNGSTLIFPGTPDLNPDLNIGAVYTVPRSNTQFAQDQDVHIYVHIGGTLANPTLELTGDSTLHLAESDLISYLVVGQPSFGVGGTRENVGTLASTFLPTIGSQIAARVCAVSTLIQYCGLQTSLDANQGNYAQAGQSILRNTRAVGGVKISNSTFLTATVGLCQFQNLVGGGNSNSYLDFTRAIGLRLEQQFGSGYSLSTGVEPSSSALTCLTETRSIIPSQTQWGLDLFRSWQF